MTRHDFNRTRAVLLATLTLLSAVTGVAAFGGTAFVQSGDLVVVDADGGQDYETIGAALANATAGDTIEVRDGTYEETVVVDEDVTLRAENESGATIRYAPSNSTGKPAVKVTANGSTVSGFVVERVAADDRGSNANFAQGIRISASDVTVENNHVTATNFGAGTNNAGVMVLDDESGGSGETVANVTISGNAVSGFAAPVAIAANYGGSVSVVDVSGNSFSGNGVTGLWVGELDGTVSSLALSGYEYTGTSDAHANVTWQFRTEADALDYGANASGAVITDANGDYVVGPGMSIQDAVNASADGDEIVVRSGTYDEQVVIEKSVAITADGDADLTWSSAPNSDFESGSTMVIKNGASVTINGLGFEGPLASPNTAGIFVTEGASLAADGLEMNSMYVDNGYGEPAGFQYHSAIVVGDKRYVDTPRNGSLTLTNSTVDGFGKSAVTVMGPSSTATIDDVEVNGSGVLNPDKNGSNPAQDTILVDGGADVTLTDSVIRDVWYNGSFTAGTGISVYGPNDVEARNNTFDDVGKPLSLQAFRSFDNTPGAIDGFVATENDITGADVGVDLFSDDSIPNSTDVVLRDAEIRNNTIIKSRIGIGSSTGESENVSVTGNQFANDDLHLWQARQTFDAQAILDGNTFDRVVLVANASDDNVYSSIQAGVDAAGQGDAVRVESGTYDETVTVDTANVTIEGPNAGTSGDGVRGDEATIDGQVVITASGVVFDGFTVSPPPAETNAGGEALRISGGPDDVVVRNNIVRNFSEDGLPEWEGVDGIVAFGGDGTDAISNVTISHNKVQDVEGRTTKGGVTGISIQGNVNGADIRDNVVRNVGMNDTAWAFGLVVRGTGNHDEVPGNVTVVGNDVSSVYSTAETDTVGVGLGVEANASEVAASHNSIQNVELLVENKDTANELNATLNWWGDANGPSTADNPWTSNASGIGGDGAVLYTPWLDAPADEGGQPTGPVENVDQGEFFLSIQAAIDAAGEGATINVGPGTYVESLSIGVDNLTLLGPNAGVPAYASHRGPEATVDANGSELAIRIQEQSGDVTVDGFAVEGWTQVGIVQGMSDSEGTSAHVLNNDVDVTGQPVAHGNSIQVTGDHSTVVGNDVEVTGYDYDETDWATSGILAEGVNDTEIVDNRVEYVDTGDVSKYYRGITVEGAPSFDGPANDNVVRNNTVVGLSTAISIQMDASNTTVEDNTIVDSNVGLAVRKYQTRGENNLVDNIAPIGVGVEGNSFDDNDVQVNDPVDTLALGGVLDTNDFDRAVVVDRPGNSLLPSIWSSIQDGVNETQNGDTVLVTSGTYEESVVVDTTNVTLVGLNHPTIVGDGVDVGSKPHAAIHVASSNGNPVTDVVVHGFTIRNPNGTYGIYAGSGGGGANVTGLTVRANRIEEIGTQLASDDTGWGSNPPLAGAVSGLYVRADYNGIVVADNRVRNVSAPSEAPGRATGISFSSFVGVKPAFSDGVYASDTVVVNNTVANVSSPDRAKGIGASGEFDGMLIAENVVEHIDGSDGHAKGITLTENPDGGDIDGDGESERVGPRNFTVVDNEIRQIDATFPSALFVGGYEDLGADHGVTDNVLLGPVQRYHGDQPGFTLADADALDATHNYWGAADGPSGAAPGSGSPIGDMIEYRPWLEAPGGPLSGSITLYVDASATGPANGSQEAPFPTIDDALDAAMAGDTIELAAGTYRGRVTITKDVTVVGAGVNATTLYANSSDVANNHRPTLAVHADATVENLSVVREVTNLSVGSDGHTKALGISREADGNSTDAVVRNVDVTLADETGSDSFGNALWVSNANALGGVRYRVNATLMNVTVTNDGVGVNQNNGFGGAAIAAFSRDENVSLVVLNSTVYGSERGLYTAEQSANVSVTFWNNDLRNNTVHVNDTAGSLDIDSVLFGNTFDRAVTVRDTNGNVTVPAVFSSVQGGVDAASAGELVLIEPGTYDETVSIRTDNVTVIGDGATLDAGGAGTAVSVNADEVAVYGLTVTNASVGIHAQNDADNLTLAENVIENLGDGSGSVQGIWIERNTEDLTVGGNVIRNLSGGSWTQGIVVFGYEGQNVGSLERLTIVDNVITNVSTTAQTAWGMQIKGDIDGLAVVNNTVTDVDSTGSTGLQLTTKYAATGPHNATVTDNVFDRLDVAVDVAPNATTGAITVRGNVLNGSTFGVRNTAGGSLDATRNYWGASTGPGGVAPGDGANVSENVTFRPFYTNPELTENSTVPPEISNVQLIDVTDGDGTVGDGDTLRVSANVTDRSGVASVTVDARPFGGDESLALTDEDGDGIYDAEFTVSAAEANVDGNWSLSIAAFDHGGANASASTNALALSTVSETRTSFTISDARPLNTEIVAVNVTVENVGQRSADRTITLIVDGEEIASTGVTVLPGQNRTVTFEYKFSAGTHAVTVDDSVFTLSEKTVVAERASNPDAGIEITAPNASQTFATDEVTVSYQLTDADEGIAEVAYSVDDGVERTVTDLNRSEITLTGLDDGSHTVEFWLVDHLGNDLSSDSVTFTIDSTEPVVEIEPARTGSIGANRSVSVNLSVDEDNHDAATFVVRNGGGTEVYTEDVSDELADGSETITWDGTDDAGNALATGEYDIALNATDVVGLTNETNVTINVDNSPPTPTVDAVSPVDVNASDTVTVTVTAGDDESAVENVSVTLVSREINFRTTAEAVNQSGTWVAEFDADGLPVDGNYTARATATDAANNDGIATSVDAFSVDTTSPSVSAIIDTKNASAGYVNVTVAGDVPDADAIGLSLRNTTDATVTVSDLSQVGATNTYSGTFEFEGSGEYSLEANATDEAGNLGTTNATANISAVEALEEGDTFTIEGNDGTVVEFTMNESVTGGLATLTSSDTPLKELGTNVGSTFLNGELDANLTNALENATIHIPTEDNVPEGTDKTDVNISRYNETDEEWILLPTEVETIDGTEYFVTTVEHFSTYGPVSPDTTAPSIDGTSLTPGGDPLAYSTSTVDVTVEYSDNKEVDANNVTVHYDGADVTASGDTSISSSEATLTATDLVGSGQHWVNVTVVDAAGNVETENVTFTVEEDTTAPTATLLDDAFDYGTDPVPLEIAFDDPLSGVNESSVAVEVDGTDVTGQAIVTASGVEYDASGLDSGTHSINVTVADDDGNERTVEEAFTVADDQDVPTVTATVPADGEVLSIGTSQVTVELQYADPTSSIDPSSIVVEFDGEDVTGDAVITGSKLTYTVVGLENGTSHTLVATIYDAEGNVVNESLTFEVDAPRVEDGEDRPAIGDRPADRLSRFLTGGKTSFEVGATVSRFGIDFADRDASGTVSIQSLDERPESVAPIPDATGIAFVDVGVPSRLADSEATLRLTVDADAVGDVDPSSLVVYHYEDGEWTALETEVVSTTDEGIVLEATTPGFSLFAVGSTQEETTTAEPETATTEPGTTTAEPGTETAQPDTPTPAPDVETDEPVREPAGFGVATALVVVLVLAVLVAVYYVRTRRE